MITTLTKATPEALAGLEKEKALRSTGEVFLLFGMGSQYDMLIKHHLDALGVFCLVADPASVTADDVRAVRPLGIILSGGPASVCSEPPPFDNRIFDLGVPLLGICLGFQMWAAYRGARVMSATTKEFGRHELRIHGVSPLLSGLPETLQVVESHGDTVEPDAPLVVHGSTEHAPASVASCGHLYGVQFHPEVSHTEYGADIFANFCFLVCAACDRFPVESVAARKVDEVRSSLSEGKVLLALSGGSDSSVVAYILKEAVQEQPGRILAVYIKGIDRLDDEIHVQEYFGNQSWLELVVVDATQQFLKAVKGVSDMRAKRVAMRGVYKRILEAMALTCSASRIAQGTLYTDVVESGSGLASGARKAEIKLHHNVELELSLPELLPLLDCVKDTARAIGQHLGVPSVLLRRHPFPGPGLLLRCEGEVTADLLDMERRLDGIFVEELRRWGLYDKVWQSGVQVTISRHTITAGDDRGEGAVVCFWAVDSVNGFTATASEFPYEFEQLVTRRMHNEVPGVGAVTRKTSGKPPATIEWG